LVGITTGNRAVCVLPLAEAIFSQGRRCLWTYSTSLHLPVFAIEFKFFIVVAYDQDINLKTVLLKLIQGMMETESQADSEAAGPFSYNAISFGFLL
jgi:hypothetical protein